MGDHLLIGEFIPFGALDGVVEDEDGTVVGGFEE